jgi:osmotically-inducible protein OsmY
MFSKFFRLKFPLECLFLSLAILLVGCVASTPKQESTGEYMDSSAVTTKVKGRLLADEKVKSLPITVTTYKGRVQLSGFVESQGQIDRAVNIARNTPGVQSVENDLVIR